MQARSVSRRRRSTPSHERCHCQRTCFSSQRSEVPMQRLTLISLAAYLFMGGCGFRVALAFALRLLLANGTYGAIMPRVVALCMFVLGGVIVQSRAHETISTPSTPSWRAPSLWW